ncbi:MAG: phosphate-binding protein, partial [Anaerolineae bacterium]|nr:phosphate-binding protein [Anaerolineae bacterium]
MNRKLFVLIAVLMVASMVLAACGPTATEAPVEPTAAPADTKAPEATMAPEATVEPTEEEMMNPLFDPALLEGSIYEAGSSTVYPLALRIAEDFQAEGFTGEFKLDSIGSGA